MTKQEKKFQADKFTFSFEKIKNFGSLIFLKVIDLICVLKKFKIKKE